MNIKDIISILRPHQYLKNTFVFVGVLFSPVFDPLTLLEILYSFVGFCLLSSSVYVLNDLLDIEQDKNHPRKKNRAIPSGRISLSLTKIICVSLLISALLIFLSIGIYSFIIGSIYFIINILYCLKLKHVVILDVFCIATGFMLRILMGTIPFDIEPSSWLLLCGFSLTLFLGFAKRRSEIVQNNLNSVDVSSSRSVLSFYQVDLVNKFLAVTTSCCIVFYGLYTVAGSDSKFLVATVPLVIYGFFRYLFLVNTDGFGEDTSKDVFKDKHLLLIAFAWVNLVFGIIWLS